MKIYERISDDIRGYIIDEKVPQGFKLPSINELCRKYSCSKGTVIKAYESLCSEHIVYAIPQKGFFVADNLVRFSNENSDSYDLSTGNPPVNSIPVKDIQHCLNSAVERYSDISLALSSTGLQSVYDILPELLGKSDIYCSRKNIYLSQGVLQVLTLLSKMPFPNGNDTISVSYTHLTLPTTSRV